MTRNFRKNKKALEIKIFEKYDVQVNFEMKNKSTKKVKKES